MAAASQTLSPVDTAWLHMEDPTNLMMVTAVALLDGPLDYERVRATIRARLVTIPRFRMRVRESRSPVGLPYWETDPTFDDDNHVHRVALPAPGDIEALQIFLGDLSSTPLDYSKPLWQIHLIENVMGGSALAMRFHHAMADGLAMMWVTARLMDTDPDTPVELDEPERRRKSSGWSPGRSLLKPVRSAYGLSRKVAGTLIHESIESLLHPSHLRELTSAVAEPAGIAARALVMPPDPQTLFKGKLGVQKHVAWSDLVELDDVKAIGQATGAKVNDILLAGVAGALRHYLLENKQPVDDVEIRAVVPVNLRTPEQAVTLGNVFGLVFLSLPMGVSDPLTRLHLVKARMDAIKESSEAVVFFGLLSLFGSTPQQVEEQVVNLFGSKATAVMTNVPGPQQTLYFAGSRVRNGMFWVPQSGRLGMGISIFSYDGHVTLGVITDAGLVPDPQRITDRFGAEFRLMLDSIA